MSVVWIVGAGASNGADLEKLLDAPQGFPKTITAPPLTNGFFRKELLDSINYPLATAATDYPHAFSYIARLFLLSEPLNPVEWEELDLERLFTYIELEREFTTPESDQHSELTLIRNQLIRFTWRVLGLCTGYAYGKNYRALSMSLDPTDSVVSFNWDLMLDHELHPSLAVTGRKFQYSNFLLLAWNQWLNRSTPIVAGNPPFGMFLKLHGSLNWFQCRNTLCSSKAEIAFEQNTQACLAMNVGIGSMTCSRCGSEMVPLIVPPLLNKPITNNPIIRSVWGLARERLSAATKAVLLGFSAARTDFYAAWLLRASLGRLTRDDIFVVNPSNDAARPDHESFDARMKELFPSGYNSEFHNFSDISAVVQRVKGHQGAE